MDGLRCTDFMPKLLSTSSSPWPCLLRAPPPLHNVPQMPTEYGWEVLCNIVCIYTVYCMFHSIYTLYWPFSNPTQLQKEYTCTIQNIIGNIPFLNKYLCHTLKIQRDSIIFCPLHPFLEPILKCSQFYFTGQNEIKYWGLRVRSFLAFLINSSHSAASRMAAELSGFLNRHHRLASAFLPGMVQSPRPLELPTECSAHGLFFWKSSGYQRCSVWKVDGAWDFSIMVQSRQHIWWVQTSCLRTKQSEILWKLG